MNILFYRYNSICEPDIIYVLKRLGHDVFEVKDAIENKRMSPEQEVMAVNNALKTFDANVVFSVNFFPAVSEVCRIYQTKYISWIVDAPVMELYSHSIRNTCNRVCIFDYSLYEEFRRENPGGVFYVPLASDVTRLKEVIESITEEDRNKYCSDVSFVGSLYTEKCPYNNMKDEGFLRGYLDGVIETQLQVYGYNFIEECITDEIVKKYEKNNIIYEFPEKSNANKRAALAQLIVGNKVTEQERIRLLDKLSKNFEVDIYTASDLKKLPGLHHKGLAESLVVMPKVFHLSKINLNFTSKPIKTGLPQRIWDIMGAGGFVLTNYQAEIGNFFEIGKDIEVFAREQELLDKVDYYLKNDADRVAIARNGCNKVRKYHSLENRLSQLLSL